jgi:recombination protein RecT
MSTDLAPPTDKKYSLEDWITSEKFKRNLEAMLHTRENVERFVQIALGTVRRNQKLSTCHMPSVFDCLLKLNQIGLEPDGYHAHLIPFKNNKTDRMEAQLIIDYKGLVEVIRRDPKVAVVKGNVIYGKDYFVYKEGSNRVFEHTPSYQPPSEDNPIVAAYSFIKFKDGDWEVDILPTWKIERARQASRAKDAGPWIEHYDEMAIKTALRHHSKTVPLLPKQREAVQADDDQFEYEPFDNTHRLPQRAPEFRKQVEDESSVPPTDQRERKEATGDSSEQRGDNGGAKAPRKQRAPRGEEASKQADNRADAGDTGSKPETVSKQGTVATSEADHKYGPNDEPTVQRQEPAKPEPAKEEPKQPAAASSSEDPKVQQLLNHINQRETSQAAVIQVLKDHDINVGEAGESGFVSDLPKETLDLALKQWGSILFAIRKAESPV